MVVYRICGLVLLVALMTSAIGCGSSGSSSGSSGGASMDAMAGQVDAQNAARKQQEAAAAAKTAADQKVAEAQAAQTPVEPERRVAGRAPVKSGGYYGAIAGARRYSMNAAESWAWKQGVGSFRATEGRKPKNNEEFMKKVIEAMQIPLPHLEENQEYEYDPAGETDGDFGQLYVVEKQPDPTKK